MATDIKFVLQSHHLDTLSGCKAFLESATPQQIVEVLRRDQEICREANKGYPTLLYYLLPAPKTDRGDEIARALSDLDSPGAFVPLAIARLQCSSLVQTIRNYYDTLKRPADGASQDDLAPRDVPNDVPPHLVPTDDDFEATFKVLQYLQLPLVREVNSSTSLSKVLKALKIHLAYGSEIRLARLNSDTYPVKHAPPREQGLLGSPSAPLMERPKQTQKKSAQKSRIHPALKKPRFCYICQFRLTSSHPLFPSLCGPCGSYNLAESSLSLPGKLDLTGKTALVTGGRVNLGYHVVLRLLRCGARVIASTRYPLDSEARYLKEPGSKDWADRLKIVGADFRTAGDVFALVRRTKECLTEWGISRLDILINNAAQTLTDTVSKESESILREENLKETTEKKFVVDAGYKPRVRGGAPPSLITYERQQQLLDDRSSATIESVSDEEEVDGEKVDRLAGKVSDFPGNSKAGGGDTRTQLLRQEDIAKSSWLQKLDEIPYEDVISAHSVNTFVPLILLRELVPLMKKEKKQLLPNVPSKPAGYVINVSSRESLPERTPNHSAKSGHHVHTNMSKAALNMLTETEASVTWHTYRVAVNSVDPGYMSADPGWIEHIGGTPEDRPLCPLGWEDGAGRVLWVVAKGETENVNVWGRFLKHFDSIHSGR